MEYGLDLPKRCLHFAWRNPENMQVFSKDDCHPSLNLQSFTNICWSLRLLEKTWKAVVFVSNKFMSCVICLVIAREIFLV